MRLSLCPTQQRTYDRVLAWLPHRSPIVVNSSGGGGTTTILQQLHADRGGVLLSYRNFLDTLNTRHPLALDETFDQWMRLALADHDLVILDNLDLFGAVGQGGHSSSYPRPGLVTIPLLLLLEQARESGKHLIFGDGRVTLNALSDYVARERVGAFTEEDYRHIVEAWARREDGTLACTVDFRKVYRFAGNLDAHDLGKLGRWLASRPQPDTDAALHYLKQSGLSSNVSLPEVQPVELSDLKGLDDVIAALEANIILPLEEDELALRLDLKPKRGVLLAGPPGTGKTTVGRALARRLGSKFFLIDGTVIAGTGNFYCQVAGIFNEAKHNAPAIVFVDDSDVIFEDGEEGGLYRYLLTMLDGLESESVNQVCVMLTAMDVGNLPPALLRSGRVELWLEMRLPDEAARHAILEAFLTKLPREVADLDLEALAAATEGFTGADLKRLVEDGKLLYAFDLSRSLPMRTATEYFLSAVEGVVKNKARYAQAEARARRRHPSRPAYYNPYDDDGDDDEEDEPE